MSIPSYPGVGITALGRVQSQRTALFLKKYLNKNNLKLDHIYSSGMTRAIQTAKIMNQVLNRPISFHEELREQNKIIFDAPNRTLFYKDKILRMKRLEHFIDNLLQTSKKTILVVCHGNAISRIVAYLQGIKPDKQARINQVHTGITYLKIIRTKSPSSKKYKIAKIEIIFANHIALEHKYVTWLNKDE